MGFEVVPADVVAAGSRTRDAVDDSADAIGLHRHLAELSVAMAGSRSVDQVVALVAAWEVVSRAWLTAAEEHAAGLVAAGRAYEEADRRAAGVLRPGVA